LFTGQYQNGFGWSPNYAVSPDGKTFLMLEAVVSAKQQMVVTLNLFHELRRR
jgi:hypothetical protein